MLFLLLTALATSPVGDVPEVDVAFGGPNTVRVMGPSNRGRKDYPWTNAENLMSPRSDAAAVRFCWDAVKYTGCEVHLARPGTSAIVLKNSNVTRLLWTSDGQHLIGAGKNTVRLWNLSGGVRIATPVPPLNKPGVTQSASVITRLWLDRGNLCVAAQDQLFDAQGQQKRQTITTTRYHLPSLKPLMITTYTQTPGRQEADCKFVTKPI